MGTMTDVDHGAWNAFIAHVRQTLDLIKFCNIDSTKHYGDHLVAPKVSFPLVN